VNKGRSFLHAGNIIVLLLVLMAVLCCCLAVGGLVVYLWVQALPTVAPTPAAAGGLPTPTARPSRAWVEAPLQTPTLTPGPAPHATVMPKAQPLTRTPGPTPEGGTWETEQRLLATELPQRDIRLIAERLKKTGAIPEVVHEIPPVYQVGDEHEFWVGNVDTMTQAQVTAVLRYVTPHLYVWVEKGVSYDPQGLARSAENFETHIYPTDRAFFGSEWSPGVDNDVHLHILHSTAEHMGWSVAGYYSSADEYSHLANPYSNEREMFYISLDGIMIPGSDFYDGVLAHEFQHMIHWANDRNEETWVNEGCSELAAYLNGYDPGGFEWSFVDDPDVQLTTWSELGSAAAHYGGSYLFMAYFLGRFGEQAMQQVVADPANGQSGFDRVLDAYGLTFDQVFADWLVANYVDAQVDQGRLPLASEGLVSRYTYPGHAVGSVALDATYRQYPVELKSTVHQYAADYVELAGAGDVEIEFWGSTEALLVPVDPHSGRYMWWSNRGDDSDAMLTRAYDLSSVDRATLQAWMWYDIEEDWDYAYVQASADGGQTWDVLAGPSTTGSNPNGNSFGQAYTGESGGWILETFDLTPYAGRQVWVRFEYVTDDAVNHAGWLIDDVCVPELGVCDDLESGAQGWDSSGFIYSDNRVSQQYSVQLIVLDKAQRGATDGLRVLDLALNGEQHGRIELRGLGAEVDSAVLVISALAPVTTEVAGYEYAIRPLP
jgi:immune inhibitor A